MDVSEKSLIEKFSRDQVTALKAVLVLLVVAGHLRSLASGDILIGALFLVYNFHVISFLILPYLYPVKELTLKQISIWALRYLTPYVIFFIAYLGLNIARFGTFDLGTTLYGLVIATARPLDNAIGTQLLWFLPALFLSQFFITGIFKNNRSPLYVGIAFLMAMAAGSVPRDIAMQVPFYGVLVCYLTFAALMLRYIVARFEPGLKSFLIFAGLFVGLQTTSALTHTFLGPGAFKLPGYEAPHLIVFTSLIITTAVLTLLYWPGLDKSKILLWLGDNSLPLFLFHQAPLHGMWHFLTRYNLPDSLHALISFSFALSVSLIGIVILNRLPRLKAFIFPRELNDLKFWK